MQPVTQAGSATATVCSEQSHSKVSSIFFFPSSDEVFVLLNLFPGVRESVLVFSGVVNDCR